MARCDSASTTAPVEPPCWVPSAPSNWMKWSPRTVRPASVQALTQRSRSSAEDTMYALLRQPYRSAMMCSPFIVIPPSKQRSAERDLHTRPRALRFWRGALKPRAAGAILLAEVYPSEKYRGEKVRKYNRIYLAS